MMDEKSPKIGLWGWGFICSLTVWFLPFCQVCAESGGNNWVAITGFFVLIFLGITSWAGVGLAIGCILIKLVELG